MGCFLFPISTGCFLFRVSMGCFLFPISTGNFLFSISTGCFLFPISTSYFLFPISTGYSLFSISTGCFLFPTSTGCFLFPVLTRSFLFSISVYLISGPTLWAWRWRTRWSDRDWGRPCAPCPACCNPAQRSASTHMALSETHGQVVVLSCGNGSLLVSNTNNVSKNCFSLCFT